MGEKFYGTTGYILWFPTGHMIPPTLLSLLLTSTLDRFHRITTHSIRHFTLSRAAIRLQPKTSLFVLRGQFDPTTTCLLVGPWPPVLQIRSIYKMYLFTYMFRLMRTHLDVGLTRLRDAFIRNLTLALQMGSVLMIFYIQCTVEWILFSYLTSGFSYRMPKRVQRAMDREHTEHFYDR